MFPMAPYAHTPNEWFHNCRSMWRYRSTLSWRNPFRNYGLINWIGLVGVSAWAFMMSMSGWTIGFYLTFVVFFAFAQAKSTGGHESLWTWWPIFVGTRVGVILNDHPDVFEWLTHNVPRNMWVAVNDMQGFTQEYNYLFMSSQHAMLFKLTFGGK